MISPAAALNGQLARISHELDECSLRVDTIVRQAGDSLWIQPGPERWSAGQCIAHLTRTNQEWAPRLEKALAIAPHGFPPYKPTRTGRVLAWFIEPPYRMKAKAAPIFTPRDRKLAPEDLVGEFLASQQEVGRMMTLANNKAIDRVIVVSPVTAKLKYDLYSAFRIIAAHQRRHLWQAERVLTLLRG